MNSKQRRKNYRERRDEIDALALQYRILTGSAPRGPRSWESTDAYVRTLRKIIGHHRELRGQPEEFGGDDRDDSLDANSYRQQVYRVARAYGAGLVSAKALATQAP